jgi:two-component system nitrogen regulation sensor histidine kinase NtrY
VFDQCTDTIIRQVDDIKRMVDEFSSFARMPKPLPESEDLLGTIRQVLFLMRIGNPDIAIVENVPAAPVTALYDRRLVAQALTNIVKNATEAIGAYRSEGAELGYKPLIEVNLQVDEAQITIDVIDNGKGFPKEARARLLEPYMTTRNGGTGLGLAIVGKILEEHGGGIALLDRADGQRGACVRLWLPIPQPDPSLEGAQANHSTRGQA